MPHIVIAGRRIGPDTPPYVIAEMSGNHNGDLSRALRLVDAAKDAGADAVKIQTFTADTITIDCARPEFLVEAPLWKGRRLYELYQQASTPWDWHEAIFRHGQEIGIPVFSSPFDPTAVDFLERLGAPAYKIASPEILDLGLIRRAAQTGKPLIISTGMANWAEIEDAATAARAAGATQTVFLHCVAAYPTPPEDMNLATIPDMARRLNMVTGLSDHSMGTAIATAAVALGAAVIEKHFTLARADGGVDSAFSLEPQELRQLVVDVRAAYKAVGKPCYEPVPSESTNLRARRSLYVVADIKAGDAFTPANLRSIRPGFGLAPKYLDIVLGRKAARDLKFGEPLQESMIFGGLKP